MKKLYPSGQAMPTRTGPSEPTQSSHATSSERMTTSHRSLLRAKSISPFHSHRWRAMVSTRTTSGSTLYGVLQRRGWLAIFSPKAVANRTQVYTKAAQQSICATRTPANNAALKGLAIAKPAPICRRGGTTVLPNRACELSEGNIFSGEFMEECLISVVSMSSLRSVWTLLRSNCEAIIHANEKPTIMDNVSCPACPTTGRSGIEDGKPVRRERRGNELNRFQTPFSSILHLLLPTIFVSVFICFSGAAKAQSRQDVGTAEAVKPLQIGDTIPEELWSMPLQVVNHPDGKDTITLNDYRDKKLIILDFWSTYCGTCYHTFPSTFNKVKPYSMDIALIPLTYQRSEIVEPVVGQNNYLQSIEGFYTVVDNTLFRKLFSVAWFPQLIVLDTDGTFLGHFRPRQLTSDILIGLLNQKPIVLPTIHEGGRNG